ncbi:hypothetical protein QP561_11145, partial [Veillonella nakazawae]|nr:hypothetical protein [Veillonella nakazawae]
AINCLLNIKTAVFFLLILHLFWLYLKLYLLFLADLRRFLSSFYNLYHITGERLLSGLKSAKNGYLLLLPAISITL